MISRDDVIGGYQKFLRRLPENEAVISGHQAAHENIRSFERSLQESAEYRTLAGHQDQLPAAHKISRIKPKDLDWFILESDRLGPPESPPVREFWQGMTYHPEVAVNQRLNPYTEEYVDQQIAVYREISGREIDQEANEFTSFNLEAHVPTANPYAHVPPHGVAIHLGRVSRAIQYSGLGIGDHVLDMGCGWGTTSELMAFAGLRVTGLDINPHFVELINRRAARIGHTVEAITGSFERIPGETQYDAVLYYESLHHAIRPWETLALVNSRLKSGGKLLLAGEPVNDIWKNWGIRTDPLSVYCIKKFGWFESGWSADFIANCVKRCGFEIKHFANESGAIGWIMVAEKVT